jgi:hypothetical protein
VIINVYVVVKLRVAKIVKNSSSLTLLNYRLSAAPLTSVRNFLNSQIVYKLPASFWAHSPPYYCYV